jgi:hypothetical protein
MNVYERDFYAWTQQQSTLLRQNDFVHLDIANLVEELESMGRSERRQLTNRLEILLTHLLKWQHQPELRGRSWQLTIGEQRRRIARLLHDSPSLQSHLDECLVDAYEDATFAATRETGLPTTTFPSQCPFTLSQVLSTDWLPL